MTDLTQQQREALEALERLEYASDYAEWEDRQHDDPLQGANTLRDRDTAQAAILRSTPVPSVPVSRLRDIADAHFQKSVDITVSGDAAARHALISAILYALAEEAESDAPAPEDSHD